MVTVSRQARCMRLTVVVVGRQVQFYTAPPHRRFSLNKMLLLSTQLAKVTDFELEYWRTRCIYTSLKNNLLEFVWKRDRVCGLQEGAHTPYLGVVGEM